MISLRYVLNELYIYLKLCYVNKFKKNSCPLKFVWRGKRIILPPCKISLSINIITNCS